MQDHDTRRPSLEHVGEFGVGHPEYTVGVEEELMLVDGETLGLTSGAVELVDRAADPDNIKLEIRPSMVEISSRPCQSADEILDHLSHLRRRIRALALDQGSCIVGGGTHPFSPAEEQGFTDTPRYHQIAEVIGWVGLRTTAVCGTHVHVAISSADKALGVLEAMLPELPMLIALAASSPLWRGRATGVASTRLAVRASQPRSGLPPVFTTYGEYVAALGALQRSGLVPDQSHLWWDVRPREHLGTLEIRVMDGQPAVRDTVAIAALVRALVQHHGQRWEEGNRRIANRLVVSEDRWQAVRFGMEATFAMPDGGAVSARDAVRQMLDRARPILDEHGSSWVYDHLLSMARSGGPAVMIRDLFVDTGEDPVEVTRALIELGDPDRRASIENLEDTGVGVGD